MIRYFISLALFFLVSTAFAQNSKYPGRAYADSVLRSEGVKFLTDTIVGNSSSFKRYEVIIGSDTLCITKGRRMSAYPLIPQLYTDKSKLIVAEFRNTKEHGYHVYANSKYLEVWFFTRGVLKKRMIFLITDD